MPTQNVAAYTAYLKGRNEADVQSVASVNKSLEHFQRAVSLDADFALAYVGLADAYLTLGANFFGGLTADESNELAEPPLMRALELDRDLGQAYASLGLLRQQQGNVQAAEEAYQRAISLQPNYPRVFQLYGRLRQDQNRREEALVFFERSLSVDPFSAPANYAVARGYDELGRFDEALEKYYRVVEIEPDHAFAFVYIAAIHYLVHGRIDEALVWYDKAARNDVLSPSLQSAQALAYVELGDTDTARVCVDNGLKLGPRTFWPLWTSLVLNMYVGDDAAATADARTMLELFPRFWGAMNYLRIKDLAAGRYEAARARYARAFRELTEPDIPDVNVANYRVAVDLALVLMRLGETERANELLTRSTSVIETQPRLGTEGYWVTDVGILALQNQPEQARRVADLRASGDLLPVAIADGE
jgi:tetratricopeptide (TPR) repeat protein